jgi:two-component sensor histidine kinase
MPISVRFVVRSAIGLLAIGFLALFAIVGTTSWLNERARINFDDIIAARDVRGAAVELRDALRTAESSQRAYIFSGNEVYLAPYDAAKRQARRQLDVLKRLLSVDEAASRVFAKLGEVTAEKLSEMDQGNALKKGRNDTDAVTLFRSNRGKALMDEANLFLTSIIQSADARLTANVSEQRASTAMLRWVSIIGGVVIVLVVAIVAVTVTRYTREIRRARDEVRDLNASLEERVKRRTADLATARNRAEVLLAEVNHRVANSLTLVASLVKLQSRTLTDQSAKDALAETQGRIYAISLLHRRLYSSGDVRLVSLDEYLTGLLEHLETSMRSEGHTASLRYELAPVKLTTDAAINLGVVVTEWVTNAFKYAYSDHRGEVRVHLTALSDGRARLVVADDGVGRSPDAPAKGTGVGTRIVSAMAATMKATIEYAGGNGTRAIMTFPLPASDDAPCASQPAAGSDSPEPGQPDTLAGMAEGKETGRNVETA